VSPLLRRGRLCVLAGAVAAFSLVLVSTAGASACAGAGAASRSARAYAKAVRCLLNQQRAAGGLAPVTADPRLARAARRFSGEMVRRRFFDHVSPAGSTVGQRVRKAGFSGRGIGETIAWGAGPSATPAAIVAMWMASPGHRAIIMQGRFRHVGLGVASGSPVGVAGARTVTADFGF
jgi:uncharacterized protein YkwD